MMPVDQKNTYDTLFFGKNKLGDYTAATRDYSHTEQRTGHGRATQAPNVRMPHGAAPLSLTSWLVNTSCRTEEPPASWMTMDTAPCRSGEVP
jgi:hypothetical protein